MKVAVAMSGGVDSSVAAVVLKRQGHEVTGLTMRLPVESDTIESATRVASELGIPHHVVDVREDFLTAVTGPFCIDYQAGRTPNPCVECNCHIKFGTVLSYARDLGAERLATGHYARLGSSITGFPVLRKASDRRKDQSYFLCRLTADQLRQVMFPVGEMTKNQVREMAAELGLSIAGRAESQEICFIPDGNAAAFVARHTGTEPRPGPILTTRGAEVGEHRGITAYTIGQRRGLGISAPLPLYVTSLDTARNAVIVGEKEEVCGRVLTASRVNWLTERVPEQPFKAKARIRYRAVDASAVITPLGNGHIRIDFDEPQLAITPGQTVAMYDGDTVLGGGTIETAGR